MNRQKGNSEAWKRQQVIVHGRRKKLTNRQIIVLVILGLIIFSAIFCC